MFGQTFAPSDLAGVAALVLLEGLLSADNALVLAIMVKHLKKDDQQRALLYGLGGAFFFRFLMIVFATYIMNYWWLQLVGGLYLLYLPIKHFLTKNKKEDENAVKTAGKGFWATVIAVELTDVAFALDSVLAAMGFITKPGIGLQQDKLWVVFFGAIIGIILLRFAASFFVRVLERYPALDNVAYTLVGWVGIKLVSHAMESAHEKNVVGFALPVMSQPVFWGGLFLILAIGTFVAMRTAKPAPSPEEKETEAVLAEATGDKEAEGNREEAQNG
ncbi:tellurium resistance protein TerC [bacterium]|nr:MAG: tellurium resistance protein TerC [bacterium]